MDRTRLWCVSVEGGSGFRFFGRRLQSGSVCVIISSSVSKLRITRQNHVGKPVRKPVIPHHPFSDDHLRDGLRAVCVSVCLCLCGPAASADPLRSG